MADHMSMNRCVGPAPCHCPITGPHQPDNEQCPRTIELRRYTDHSKKVLQRLGLPRWRHKKRGTYYTALGTARLQLASPVVIEEGAVLVIYRGDDGVLWARPEAEFKDGRFEQVTADAGGTQEVPRG